MIKKDCETIDYCYKIVKKLIEQNKPVKNTIAYQIIEDTFATLKIKLGPKQFDDLMTGKIKWSDL